MEEIKSSKSFDMLKSLMTLGSSTTKVEISGYTFEIGTLTEKESSELLSSLIVLDDQERIISSKSHSIAMALKKINDIDFDSIIENTDQIPEGINSLVSKKIFFIKALQTNIVNRLFEKYTELNVDLNDDDSKKK